MSTYVVGDVQGCFDTFEALLHRLSLRPGIDRLWLVGDLVNRGPKSLEVLRWLRDHDPSVVCVLGNHDLHLLACAAGVAQPKGRDTLDAILRAPDRDELIDWLRRRPLLHREGRWLMVHAGLLPQWSVAQAARLAGEVEAALRADDWQRFIGGWRRGGEDVPRWSAGLDADQRRLLALHVMTRVRMLDRDGDPAFDYTGPPETAPASLRPWFTRWKDSETTVLFGHWAALGRRAAPGVMALDSGCVWGQALSALRLEDGAIFEERARDASPRAARFQNDAVKPE